MGRTLIYAHVLFLAPEPASVMRFVIWALPALFLAGALQAQTSTAEGITLLDPPRDEVYGDVVRISRVQSRLYYVDEADGPIPMDNAANIRPPEPELPDNDIPEFDTGTLLSRIALVFVGLFVAYFAYQLLSRWRPGAFQPRQPEADAGPLRDTDLTTDVPLSEVEQFLTGLRAMPDQREALALLLTRTMAAAAAQNTLRVRRSETARDFLRRLPRSWRALGELRQIAMAQELVVFGGRPLSPETFNDCLRRAEVILRGLPT